MEMIMCIQHQRHLVMKSSSHELWLLNFAIFTHKIGNFFANNWLKFRKKQLESCTIYFQSLQNAATQLSWQSTGWRSKGCWFNARIGHFVFVSLGRHFTLISLWGQAVYPSWWPRPTKDMQNEPQKRVSCVGVVDIMQNTWFKRTNKQ